MKILRVEPEWDDTPRPLKRRRRWHHAAALPFLAAALLAWVVGLLLGFLLAGWFV